MKKIKLFQKHFSRLDDIQEEQDIAYYLVSPEKGMEEGYGITLQAKCGAFESTETVEDVSEEKQLVENIIAFLYENAVTVDTLKDVTEDLVYALGRKKE